MTFHFSPRSAHVQSSTPELTEGALPQNRRRREEPLRVAVIGAGPAGLEAAIYAKRLGLKVLVFEREAQCASDVRLWSHVTMFTPWRDNRSPLGEAVLRQAAAGRSAPGAPLPSEAVHPTGGEFVESYLDPLAHQLNDCLFVETRVVGVGRSFLFPEDFKDAPERRMTRRFRLLTRSPVEERLFSVDHIIDASGTSHSPNWLGPGGMPALGEMGSRRQIHTEIPDILGRDRIHFLGKRTLLVGDGSSAATSALRLAEVARMDPPGSFVWATKGRGPLPTTYVPDDPLPRRDLLYKKANLLVAEQAPGLEFLHTTQVEAVQHSLSTGRFQVTLQVDHVTRRLTFDSIISNVGARTDSQTFERHLQADEPGIYTIGSKRHAASQEPYLLASTRNEIRDCFRKIMSDEALDLYAPTAEAFTVSSPDEVSVPISA